MSTYHRGRSVFRQLTKQQKPLDPKTFSQRELLILLGVNPKAVTAALHHGNGDVFNLAGMSKHALTELPSVGDGTAVRLRSIITLAEGYAAGAALDQSAQLEPLMGKLETRALLRRAEGDVFTLVGEDITELAKLEFVGPATVARLVALFELVGRYTARSTLPSAAYAQLEAA